MEWKKTLIQGNLIILLFNCSLVNKIVFFIQNYYFQNKIH